MPDFSASLHTFLKFLKSTDFSRGLLMATAAVASLGAAYSFGNINVGVAMAIGALVSSPSDVAGNFRRRVLGIFISICLAVLATIISGYASGDPFIFGPVLALVVFSFSLISVYGFRASLIAFSGIFAVVLSMARVSSGESVLLHALWIGLGGLLYLSLSVLLSLLRPEKQAEELLAEGFRLTSRYLKLRAELINTSSEEREDLQQQLSELQSAINEKHETIRDLVISRRVRSGRSGDARKKMLIFIEMVDILELSMANPVNYERMDELFREHRPKLDLIKKWSLLMAEELSFIATAVERDEKYTPNPALETWRLKANMATVVSSEEGETPISAEAALVLSNLVDFKEKQQEKIISISRLLRGLKVGEELAMKDKEAVKFITGQEYSFKTLLDNFSFASPIFRHSVRLSIILLAGYIFGTYFELQNTYWILLTSLVIMRPGYSLTKNRSKERLYGTLIGVVIAIFVVILTRNVYVYGVLAVITLIFALAMLQRNYKASAIFITLNIVFVYSLLTPDPFEVITFRLVDTIIGAGLAFLGNAVLWPTWEYRGIRNFITESIKANAAYLEEIDDLYQDKVKTPTSYKLARKQAFLAMGNLNAAFQRMTQEPKSKQLEVGSIYKIVSLNQEFLSSAASLGTFIRTHRTTEASVHFKTYISAIRNNLLSEVGKLQQNQVQDEQEMRKKLEQALKYFDKEYKDLVKWTDEEVEAGKTDISGEMRNRFQEVQLVRDQLKWLFQISQNLKIQIACNFED